MKSNKKPIFLLSIDGGGVFGLLALQILEHMEQRMNRPISALFDCIAGVSAGGLIALGLVAPHPTQPGPAFSARELSDFFVKSAQSIFQKTTTQYITHKIPLIHALDVLLFSKYCSKSAQELYRALFGQTCMSQALTHTIVPAYNISGSTPKGPCLKLFDSLALAEKKQSFSTAYDFLMYEIALATSAVPTYFPPHRIHTVGNQKQKVLTHDYLIDGGVAINNPTILAYSDLRLRYPNSPIHVLSLGLGPSRNPYKSILNNPSPGMLVWLGAIGHLIVSPQLSVYEKIFENLKKEVPMSGNYWRIQPLLGRNLSEFDDVSEEHFQRIAKIGLEMKEHHRHVLDAVETLLLQKIRFSEQ